MASEPTSRAPSPIKSQASTLWHGDRRDPSTSSGASIASDENSSRLRRNSLRAGLDRLKDTSNRRISSDLETRHGESPSRLSRLLRTRTRRKPSGSDLSQDYQEENSANNRLSRRIGKGLGLASTHSDSSSLRAMDRGSSKLNLASGSTESLGPNRSAASSLLTEDSDPDVSHLLSPSRPTLAPRQSHKALLTFNSPLIAAEAIPATVGATPSSAATSFPPESTTETTQIDSPRTISKTASPLPSISRRSNLPTPPIIVHPDPSTTPPLRSIDSPAVADTKTSFQEVGSGRCSPESAQPLRSKISAQTSFSGTPPSTLVTPPTPTFSRDLSPSERNFEALSTRQTVIPTKEIIHRRTRSATAASSKLSSQIIAPLTPTIEESKTPGGSLITPSGSSGFFSSVFSATQNAVNQISNTFQINSTSNQRTRSGTSTSEPDRLIGAEEVILNSRAQTREGPVAVEPAVKTLGSGNLSLSHLGISDSSQDHSPMSSQLDIAVPSGSAIYPGFAEKEEALAAAAVDAAYHEKPGTPVVNDSVSNNNRPLSINSAVNSVPGDQTPPRREPAGEGPALYRSGSVRSRFSGRKKKRSRGSSAATGSAIAAALASTSNALVNPGLGVQRMTGFAVASSKRNKDFHALFKSVPEDDLLIEDYSAALQRDILLHGRMYVSERHICFSSNILGWQTNLVMSFDEIVAMEKKSTAMIFPNAIVIQTLHAKNIFASFLSRDPTYDLLVGIWKIGHPNLRSSDNGHILDDQAKSETAESADEDDESDRSEYSGEYGDSQEPSSFIEATSSMGDSEYGDAPRLPSQKLNIAGVSASGAGSPAKITDGSATGVADFPGPTTHPPTECTDQECHFDKEVVDTTIPAPLGKVYDMMFGPKSGMVMRRFLTDDQNSRELELEDDKTGMGETVKTFTYSYIKPLNSSIGPKQTKCLVTQTLDAFDLERAVSVTCSTQTPDVPSGNVFVTKTKYCLMWGPGNSTRFIMNSTVEWSGKSWLKGPIEKGASDGQAQYGKDIVRFFTSQVVARLGKTPKAGGKIKGKKKRSATDMNNETNRGSKSSLISKDASTAFSLLGLLRNILSSLLTPAIGLSLLVLIIATVFWYRVNSSGTKPGIRLDRGQYFSDYEDLWRTEEDQLWNWLETRLELYDAVPPLRTSARPAAGIVDEDRTSKRKIEEAIRVTEERLEVLKQSAGMSTG